MKDKKIKYALKITIPEFMICQAIQITKQQMNTYY